MATGQSLSWRWRRKQTSGAAVAEAGPLETPGGGQAQDRAAMLDAIRAFILDWDLALTPANLLAAYNAACGPAVATPQRLSDLAANDEPADPANRANSGRLTRDSLKILDDLQEGIEAFAQNTNTVRAATSEYSSELDRHLVGLESAHVNASTDMLASLVELTRTMSERTRQTEAALKKSEREATALRRRLEKARREAEHDPLTGLPNRRAFDAHLERQYMRAKDLNEPLAVAFCDIDHFKRVNDEHGHHAGDRILKTVAHILAAGANDSCHVARHGGEEFVLLFSGIDATEAKERLDIVRENLASRTMVNRDSDKPFGRITFSAGVANVLGHRSPGEALKSADMALYRAKASGRNQVLVAEQG